MDTAESAVEGHLKTHVGKSYIFRSNSIIVSGCFCGIGNFENKQGMIFIDATVAGIKVPSDVAIVVHPSDIKCTLYSNILKLRRLCINILGKNADHDGITYCPIFAIEEMKYEESNGHKRKKMHSMR